MNILGKMWDALFKKGNKGAAPPVKAAPAPAAKPAPTQAAPTSLPTPPPPPPPVIDVEEVLEALAAQETQKLNWRASIVDLMKLLDMDSSLAARKELAAELGYKGDTKDSAAMNIWLHKEVIRLFAANGGKVPAELLD